MPALRQGDPLTARSEFEEDAGTFHLADRVEIALAAEWEHPAGRRAVARALGRRPVVWFVDDERRNRRWFARAHRARCAVLTLSGLAFATWALDAGVPCDVVVTDVFFPAAPVGSDAEAERLLGIYGRISESKVSDLPTLWAAERAGWALDGFEIARVTARAASARGERIPVLLFSRKATWLLGPEDWLETPAPAVANASWVVEKVDPAADAETARRAAAIQWRRIQAALRDRSAAAPWWLRALGRLGLGRGPTRFSLGPDDGAR